MTILFAIGRFLKAIPWQVWVITAVLLIGWRWHSNAVTEAVAAAVKVEQKKCKDAAVAEAAKVLEAAEKSRKEWQAKLDARVAEVGELQSKLDADALRYKKQIAQSDKVAKALSQELYDYVRTNPLDSSCVLTPEHQRLRAEQIRQANERPNRPSGVPGG